MAISDQWVRSKAAVAPLWSIVSLAIVVVIWFLRGNAGAAGSVAFTAYLSCLVTLFAVVIHSDRLWYALFVFLSQAAATIAAMAAVYSRAGLVIAGEISDASVRDGIYFSIVTWTTLGYGDMTPRPEMRLVAASQAVLGYIYLGVFVSLVMSRSRGGRA